MKSAVIVEAVRTPHAKASADTGYFRDVRADELSAGLLRAIVERSGIEPRLIEVSRVLRLSPGDRVRKIIIPAALPRIFLAFRLAAGIALIVAVTVEIAINPIGLGAAIMTAQQALRPDLMLAYLVWIGVIGYALNIGLVVAQQDFGDPAQLAAIGGHVEDLLLQRAVAGLGLDGREETGLRIDVLRHAAAERIVELRRPEPEPGKHG